MSWFKIKLDPADTAFSTYIRAKAKWRCEKCRKLCKYGTEWVANLDASHYWSRSHEGTRFDEENVHALCSTCHRRMGGHTKAEDGEYDIWMKELLGQKGFDLLAFRANSYHRKDRKLELIYWRQKLKELASSL